MYQRGPHWYEAQRINSVLKIYGNFLLGRKSIGVFRANTTTGIPFAVGNITGSASSVASLSNQGHAADWLIGEFDLAGMPRWGGQDRLPVPAGYTIAVVLQNQDESRNVWSTVQWSGCVICLVLPALSESFCGFNCMAAAAGRLQMPPCWSSTLGKAYSVRFWMIHLGRQACKLRSMRVVHEC